MFYLLKKKKSTVSSLPRALFTLALTSALQSRHPTHYIISNHHGQNRITIQPNRVFFHHFGTITIIYDTG